MKRAAVSFLLALLLPLPARAETIALPNTLVVRAASGGPISVQFGGLDITAFISAVEHRVDLASVCVPCWPGTMLSLDIVATALSFDGTYNGQPISGSSPSSGFVGQFFFTGTAGPVPALQGETASISAPFEFSGRIWGPFADFPPPHDIDVSWTRAGIATISLFAPSAEEQFWGGYRAVYDFGTAEPVPEPGTLLLVGSALTFLGRRAYRLRA